MTEGMRGRIRQWARRIGSGLLWALAILLAGAAVNLLGVHRLGGVDGWEGWLDQHRVHLLTWRIALYAATLVGWCWMRKRLLARETEGSARPRLRRTEFAAVAVIVTLECTTWVKAT